MAIGARLDFIAAHATFDALGLAGWLGVWEDAVSFRHAPGPLRAFVRCWCAVDDRKARVVRSNVFVARTFEMS